MTEFIPVNRPRLDGNELRYVQETLQAGWISGDAPIVGRFETEFAASIDRRHGIAVSSGTAALEVALRALGIGPGDEVVLPTFSIIACALAVLRVGATPVLVDSDPTTWNMAASSVEERVGERTGAVMAVHTYGLPVDLAPILSLAERRGLKVLEDAAEAHGLTYRGRPCGSFGDASAFSFYANKLVAAGEGGLVAVDSDALAATCRSYRNLCFQPERRFVHEELGWNYRMPALSAAVATAQLERAPEFLAAKRRMGRAYSDDLRSVRALETPAERTADAENAYWVYGVVMREDSGWEAEDAMKALRAEGVDTRPFFWPLHLQPAFQKRGLFIGEHHPVAERLGRRGFYLPSGNGLTESERERVVRAVRKVFSRPPR